MRMTTVVCEHCGKQVEKPKKEVTRSIKLGRKSFCGNSCGTKFSNTLRKAKEVTKCCLECGKEFTCFETAKAASFCSRSCASKNSQSITTKRITAARQAGLNSKNLLPMHEIMKRREAWKYVELEERLQGYPHEFEYKIGNFIFDLVLPCSMVAVEFDGPDHRVKRQKIADAKKDQAAEALGYRVIRKEVKRAAVIPSCVLDGVVP